jgi:hypothetical protein
VIEVLKETKIETIGNKQKVENVLKWYKEVEKKLGGNKRYVIKKNPHAAGYFIVMIG